MISKKKIQRNFYNKPLVTQVQNILKKYNGVLWAPSLSTCFSDSACTTPAVVDGVVGCMIDTSGFIGANVAVNSGFDADISWTKNTGHTISSGVLNIDGTAGSTYQSASIILNVVYKVTLEVKSTNGVGTLGVFVSGDTGVVTIPNSVGVKTAYIVRKGNTNIGINISAGCICIIDNFIVQPVGINASQTTTGFKPMLRKGTVNQMLYSEVMTNSVWFKTGAITASGNVVNFPNLNEALTQSQTLPAHVGAKATVSALLSGSGTIYLGCCRSTGGLYEETKVKITLTGTPTIYSVTHTIINTGQLGFAAYISRASDGTATSVTVGYIDLVLGGSVAQHVATTTAPASNGVGNYWLDFDGVDDFLQLSVAPWSMVDSYFATVCIRPTIDAVTNRGYLSIGASGNTVNYPLMYYQSSGNSRTYNYDTTTLLLVNASTALINNTSVVVSSIGTITSVKMRHNAVDKGLNTGVAQTNQTLNDCRIGMAGPLSGSGYYKGALYGVSLIKGTLNYNQSIAIERYLASLSGITI